jgi:hypothetical protein
MLEHFEKVQFLDLKDNLKLSMLTWLWSTVDGSKSIFDYRQNVCRQNNFRSKEVDPLFTPPKSIIGLAI